MMQSRPPVVKQPWNDCLQDAGRITLKWTLGCITPTAWGLLTLPGTFHPVPTSSITLAPDLSVRGRYPHAHRDLFADWAARCLSSPPPSRGQCSWHKMHTTNNYDIGPSWHMMHTQLQEGSHEEGHKMRPPRPHKMHRHGRKQLGLKVYSPRMRAVNGRGASGLHDKPAALEKRGAR